ncbi:HD-GYP domain-containing protein [Thiolapillus sp.]
MPSAATIPIDTVETTTQSDGCSEQLKRIHKRIQQQYPFVSGIEIALHHSASQAVKLFSVPGGSAAHALMDLLFHTPNGKPQVIHDLAMLAPDKEEISRSLQISGYKSGLSIPFRIDAQKHGVALYAATRKDCFTPTTIEQMQVYTRVIAQVLTSEHGATENLHSAVSAILRLNHVSQSESPSHLKRVAHYSRLIARNCEEARTLGKEWIEHLYLFSPLHDIGKVFMPEELLNKPGAFTDAEFELMKTHSRKGRELIDHMIESFGYDDEIHYADMLRNIITYHHEAIDGSGYPLGLQGKEIPLEARIVSVADVLDALMTKRVYKEAWSVDKSIAMLHTLAGNKLDTEFVEIMASNKEQLVEIRAACAT